MFHFRMINLASSWRVLWKVGWNRTPLEQLGDCCRNPEEKLWGLKWGNKDVDGKKDMYLRDVKGVSNVNE